jgi:porin
MQDEPVQISTPTQSRSAWTLPRHRPRGGIGPIYLRVTLALIGAITLPQEIYSQEAPAKTQEDVSAKPNSEADAAKSVDDFWTRTALFGDMGGIRTAIGKYGFTLTLQERSEVIGNLTGGTRKSALYAGLTTGTVQFDTQKGLGWQGGTFNMSLLQIHGRNISAENLLSLQTVSGIEAPRSTRLWELWYSQSFLGGQYDLRIGQQSLDQEFIVTRYGASYLNTMLGWPILTSGDLYAGGPAYPLSSLGVRLKDQVTDSLTALIGVFDDNPPGHSFNDDSPNHDRLGLKFNLNTGALVIGELQYVYTPSVAGSGEKPASPQGFLGTYKIGAWYDTGTFNDQRYDTTGLSLADPASSGIAKKHSGNYSAYFHADQIIWRPDPAAAHWLGLFFRMMGAPSDRNLISFSLNAGVNMKEPFPGRENDRVGIGYGFAKISPRDSGLDRDSNLFNGTGIPIRTNEQFIEVTYQYLPVPWWLIQPDVQYVFRPGGSIVDPRNPSVRLHDELVLAVRTTLNF